MMARYILLTAVLIVTVAGCTIGRQYQRPVADVPDVWVYEEEETQETVNTRWWAQFNDPVLNELIRTALEENKEAAIAAARVEQYLGTYRATRGGLFPYLEAEGAGARQRVTKQGAVPWSGKISPVQSSFRGVLSASWEIDLWGKLRLATEAAKADILSAEEAKNAVILTLVTAVAQDYLTLLSLDKQLQIAKRTAESRKESLRIFRLRYQWGVVSELELSQIESQYEETLSVIPSIEREIALKENALNILLGRNPGPVKRGLPLKQVVLPEVPAGVPSDVLERRPDIRRAEQNLIAAHARVDVARSYYFPSISLTGMLGSESSDLHKLMRGSSEIWTLGARGTLPLFTAGRISGQVDAARAFEKQTLISYQQTIQNAFKEVEDALVSQKKAREILQARIRQLEAVRNYRRNAELRYENGYSGYLEVLDADRTLFSTELSYVEAKTDLFTSLVDIYKSMGGGWVVAPDP